MANVTFILALRDRVSKTASKINGSLNRITSAAEQASDAIDGIGIVAGGAAVAGLFQMGAELEKTTLFFNTLTGSVENGTKLFNELTEFANATPFSNQALNKNAQTLLAFGQEADGVIDTLRMLGDVAGGDQERLGSLTLAFAQAQSAGKLMGQDLLQFINAGFNPLNEIAKQTGKSMGVLKDEMSKGLISFDMVKGAFKAATGEGGKFHNLTNSMANTMAGKWSTALGKGMFLISELGLAMKGIFTPVLDALIKVVEWMSKFRNVVFPILKIVTVFTSVVVVLVGALKLWVMVQKILNTLLLANPLGLIIAAIALLTAGIVVLYNESETFRLIVAKTWNALKALTSVLKAGLMPAFAQLWAVVQRIGSQFKTLFSIFEGGKSIVIDWAWIIEKVLTYALINVLLPIKVLVNKLTEIWTIVSKIGTVIKAVFVGDFAAAKVGLVDLGNTIKDFLMKRVNLFLQAFGNLSDAVKDLFAGDYTKAAENAYKGVKQLVFSPFGVDVNETVDTAKKAAKAAIDAFNASTEAGSGISIPGLSTDSGLGIPTMGMGSDLKKLQAEGVVSGGIKTFNINIGTLTGVNTLTTETVQGGATQAGIAFRDELLNVLADIKQLG